MIIMYCVFSQITTRKVQCTRYICQSSRSLASLNIKMYLYIYICVHSLDMYI